MAVQDADMAGLWDLVEFNSGFVIVRPSALSLELYRKMRQLTATTSNRGINDQEALNKALNMMKDHSEHGHVLRTKILDKEQFICGKNYFERSGRLFPFDNSSGSSNKPVVVHNNYIVTKEAKIYRFREHLMWLNDGDNQYYSSETRNYLTYTNVNPRSSSATAKNVVERELSALKTALAVGHLLNRVVILPRFHRGDDDDRQCPLNFHVHIKTFDFVFLGLYRESSFLRHPKVPDSVKQSVKDLQFRLHDNQSSDILVSGTDVMRLFGKENAKVINLNDLQRVRIDANDRLFDREFSSKLQAPFRRSSYVQI